MTQYFMVVPWVEAPSLQQMAFVSHLKPRRNKTLETTHLTHSVYVNVELGLSLWLSG